MAFLKVTSQVVSISVNICPRERTHTNINMYTEFDKYRSHLTKDDGHRRAKAGSALCLCSKKLIQKLTFSTFTKT